MENQKLWYVVNTYSGHESKVKENLLMRKDSMGMGNNIFRVIVPETKEVEIKDGIKKEKTKKMFPGYVLVEMIMSDEAWYAGKGAKPIPLSPQEIDKILASEGLSRLDIETDLQEGDSVKIVDGPFNGMFGKVQSIDLENEKLNVLIDLFGQETPVEVDLVQISKC